MANEKKPAPRAKYFLTETATSQYRKIIFYTAQKFGVEQAKKYRAQLRKGILKIAEKNISIKTSFREETASHTSFSIHLVVHHYIAFQVQTNKHIIIAGIFHESMDLPARLLQLQEMSKKEIAAINRQFT